MLTYWTCSSVPSLTYAVDRGCVRSHGSQVLNYREPNSILQTRKNETRALYMTCNKWKSLILPGNTSRHSRWKVECGITSVDTINMDESILTEFLATHRLTSRRKSRRETRAGIPWGKVECGKTNVDTINMDTSILTEHIHRIALSVEGRA